MKTISHSLLFFLLLNLTTACSKEEESAEAKEAVPQDTVAQEKTDNFNQKINVYVTCINKVEPEFLAAIEKYKSWVDFAEGPNKKGSVYGITTVEPEHSFYVACFKGLKAVSSMKPKEEGLDKAGATYKIATEELATITAEAAKYYKHSDYEDDDFKKGKELHPKLVSSIEKYMLARLALHENLDRVTDERNARELLAIEKKEGRKVKFHRMNIMGAAKQLLSKVHSPEVEVLAKASDRFAKAYQDAEAFNKANPEIAADTSYWESVVSRAEDLHIAFKNLTRFRSENKKGSKKWNKNLNKATSKVFKTYNKLIDKSNLMSGRR